ncbi:putative quinol monooxygenase [Hydrogenophaga sp. PAMC20947]|uniref:putative quinol monooxygenase n=1 Tax=Hydrogenophaga sp. PAMC20947 TaxID=2565558 RepID=UPI00109DD14D|nr:putative quinol monooxygenase [Hydrogenophaga sp. PAMC20947]QCB47165.1 antibiotic biosynthesis monooxygenase [Hydrogenophaga sp. PAMC20947]
MQALVVDFHIHPGFEDAFETAICDNARSSLEQEPGCHMFDVCRDPADPGLFFLYELYTDEAAVQAHLEAPHFKSMSELTATWVASKRVQRLRRL